MDLGLTVASYKTASREVQDAMDMHTHHPNIGYCQCCRKDFKSRSEYSDKFMVGNNDGEVFAAVICQDCAELTDDEIMKTFDDVSEELYMKNCVS